MTMSPGQGLSTRASAIWPELAAEQRQAVIRCLAQLALKQLYMQVPRYVFRGGAMYQLKARIDVHEQAKHAATGPEYSRN